jgi:hypothetical protein
MVSTVEVPPRHWTQQYQLLSSMRIEISSFNGQVISQGCRVAVTSTLDEEDISNSDMLSQAEESGLLRTQLADADSPVQTAITSFPTRADLRAKEPHIRGLCLSSTRGRWELLIRVRARVTRRVVPYTLGSRAWGDLVDSRFESQGLLGRSA